MRRLLIALTLCVAAVAGSAAQAAPPPRPKLVVVISVDQFAASLFAQYRSWFSGGLARMASEGAVFPAGFQSHAATETCPGHSTILTGRHPAANGIIGNTWYNRTTGQTDYCVTDPAGPVPGRAAPRGPANLKVPTLGEWMKAADPRSRVFAVSGKDRAAIMLAGHNPDGVFWWDDELGFSTYVPAGTTADARLAPVAAFNIALFAKWKTSPPLWHAIDKRCAARGGTYTFGKLAWTSSAPPPGWTPPARGTSFAADDDFKRWFRASPGFDELTLDAATMLIDTQRLGHGPAPDLLAISLSATDYVGHRYGNGGAEMCDQLAHLDRSLGAFLAKLDKLGVPVVVVLTADHGSVDAAERAAERGAPAQRIDAAAMMAEVNAAVRKQLNIDYDALTGDGEQINIVPFGETDEAAARARIETAAIAALKARPEVVAVFTQREALAATPPQGKPVDELTLLERFAESTDAARSGDLLVALKPDATFGIPVIPGDTVGGHGSPWNYDRRVPILFWWPGATGFEQPLPIETVDIAPTLASLLGITPPAVDGRCLDLDATAGSNCSH
jgi:predicted AlkP superfamily pyrophosphatase or phosphodiesterase